MGAVQGEQVDGLRADLERLRDQLDEIDPDSGNLTSAAAEVIVTTHDLIDAERRRVRQGYARLSNLIRRIACVSLIGLVVFAIPLVAGVFSRWWLLLLGAQLCVAGCGWTDEATAPARLQPQRLVAAIVFAATALGAGVIVVLQPAA